MVFRLACLEVVAVLAVAVEVPPRGTPLVILESYCKIPPSPLYARGARRVFALGRTRCNQLKLEFLLSLKMMVRTNRKNLSRPALISNKRISARIRVFRIRSCKGPSTGKDFGSYFAFTIMLTKVAGRGFLEEVRCADLRSLQTHLDDDEMRLTVFPPT